MSSRRWYCAVFALARYNADGSLDESFGSGGRVLTSFRPPPSGPGAAVVTGLVRQPNGRLVAAGYGGSLEPGEQGVAVARYRTGGSLDSSFGSGGRTLLLRGRYRAADVALQSGARAVLALYDPRACDRCEPSAVIRLRSDGSRDRGFARKGFARPPRDGRRGSSVSAVAVAGGGRIVAAGSVPGEAVRRGLE